MHLYLYVCTYLYMHIYIYMCVCVCIRVCMYLHAYVCTYYVLSALFPLEGMFMKFDTGDLYDNLSIYSKFS